MALTTENALQLRGYTLRNEGGPLLDILDPDGKLRVTVYADLLGGRAPRFDPASIPAAEALTCRILDLLNRDLAAPTFAPLPAPPPTPLLDRARADARCKLGFAERAVALAELHALRPTRCRLRRRDPRALTTARIDPANRREMGERRWQTFDTSQRTPANPFNSSTSAMRATRLSAMSPKIWPRGGPVGRAPNC